MRLAEGYEVRKRAVKYARIRVAPDGSVTLTVPRWYRKSDVQTLLADKQSWIEERLSRFAQLRQERQSALPTGSILWRGEVYRFVRQVDMKTAYEIDESAKALFSPLDLLEEETRREWLRAEAKKRYPRLLDELVERHGFRYKKLFVRGQKTKWGSCSSLGNISLNYRLMQAPPFVLEYVMLHELCHTVELNHSPRFWRKVKEVCPDYEQAERWMKEKGYLL